MSDECDADLHDRAICGIYFGSINHPEILLTLKYFHEEITNSKKL